ncbi:type I restriction endonuclease subunit R [Chroococcus sp. FPU101]|uniref:type I restriction endonuclease subunit R n=1 Tax=Chroococcus sp. FPU101 TaxID=1974212 RepID=UPI001A8C9780|nr:type I restriction endonuclease [Chroococcus sp. FPU101]GFE71898.1 type I restriction-modification system R subunit [Chroococcus sp. FPU101]
MTSQTTEQAFELEIVNSLIHNGGYQLDDAANFSRELAFNKATIFHFIQTSQPEAWQKLSEIHGLAVEPKFIQRLYAELELRGMLDVLRYGITDYSVRFKLAFFKPASGLNPDTLALYDQNILTVTRQVRYSLQHENSIDLLLSINGLPVATVELKNQFTGQDVDKAKRQYMQDRDHRDLLFQFKRRALVHFAVDPDEVWMTTRIDGSNTRFLPFNKGYNKGAGNPPNPNGTKTAYLWEDIWAKDSWLDIVGRFLHLEQENIKLNGKSAKKETLIFPRFHQLDVVRKLTADAKVKGPGHDYLIQHSAGSGKSNSIAWLAYQLASLYNNHDERVFDLVIVITDRRVLDQQLQDTIYQFEHKQGVVQKIDKNSTQLAEALVSGTNIIITTLQKFPFVLDKIQEILEKNNIAQLPKRNYALIVDEAHSSQSGETSKKMKEILSINDLSRSVKEESMTEEEDDIEDNIRKEMRIRGKQPNLSFFAFTATPKQKTLEDFGHMNAQGHPEPFHLYSMRQAIEEGFIMDVLQNYTTYKTYFQISKAIADDPKINTKKASRAIARFLSLHPHNLAQKTEVIIEHFRQCVMHKIGGKAKAMVVTASRPHVVRYKEEFDNYLKKQGYVDIKALVAFTSFTDRETAIKYTEYDINGFGERELPEKFETGEYQLLIVADKYQTGFDQPLLHTMYVDKKLSGVKAVQTLSRLNRTCSGKEDTFVLDFANEEQEIIDAFQPYYEQTTLASTTDPNRLYDLKNRLDGYQIIWPSEVDAFAQVFFKSQEKINQRDHSRLHSLVDPAIDRFKGLSEEEQDEFKNSLTAFIRLYAFLAQIMPFADEELEKFYAFARLLQTKLPKRSQSDVFKLTDKVALEYYRLQKIREGRIVLEKNAESHLQPITEAGIPREKETQAKLSEIIDILNQRFRTDFTEADKYFFSQIEEALVQDQVLSQQAKSNSIQNFRYGFEEIFLTKLIERMDLNQDIFAKIIDDKEFGSAVKDWILEKVYHRLTQEAS